MIGTKHLIAIATTIALSGVSIAQTPAAIRPHLGWKGRNHHDQARDRRDQIDGEEREEKQRDRRHRRWQFGDHQDQERQDDHL